jgi:hypothetical protein
MTDLSLSLEKAARMALEAITQYLSESPDPSEETVEGLCDARAALRERLAQPEQTVSMTEYKRLQDLVTRQGIRLMEYESAQPEQEPFCYHDGRNIVGKEYAGHSDVFPLYTTPPAPAQQQPVAKTKAAGEQA